WPSPGSGSRTRCNRRATRTLGLRPRLAGQDLRQAVDVDLVEDAAPAGGLQPHDELGAEDVDLAVQDPALVADLALLRLEIVDQPLQLHVGERAEIREGFQNEPFLAGWVDDGFQQTQREPSTST